MDISQLQELEDSERQIKKQGNIPRHVAIIMDGNGRWAIKQNKPRNWGHFCGVDAVRTVVEAASDIGVKILSLYVFSAENWKRPKSEVEAIFSLIDRFIIKELSELDANNVTLRFVGDLNLLPKKTRESILLAQETLQGNRGLILNLALNYGGRDEIVRACKKVSEKVLARNLELSEITEASFSDFLDTSGLDEPELMIRTSGERRLSNFLLWQCAYTELYFLDEYWPNFKRKHFYEAILDFQIRQRRFGGI